MRKTILITGATSGIGLALAQRYAAQGARLLLIGRRPLPELQDGQQEDASHASPPSAPLFTPQSYCQCDLTQPDFAAQIVAFLAAQGITQLNLLIHNAGVGYYGDIAAQTTASLDDLLAVNLLAPIRLTQALYPLLRPLKERPLGERPASDWPLRSKVAFISSAATAVPTPDYAAYGASKAALEGFARSLRVEWQDEIDVQLIRPGATRTPMHEKLGIPPEKMDWRKFPPAAQTATQIAAALESGKRCATIGLANQLLTFVGRNGRFLLDPLLKKTKTGQAGRWLEPLTRAQRRVVITGGADGIGKALAWEFARAGYAVVGIDRDSERAAATAAELQQAGHNTHFLNADLGRGLASCDEELARLVEALRPFGPLHCLIHNAGISAVGRFAQVDLRTQEEVIAVNLRAPLLLTAALERAALFPADVSLVFLSSLSHYSSYPGAAAYAASKDGLAHYARSLAMAWPHAHTLTVFPGPTRTAHARRYSPDNRREAVRMPPERVAAAIYLATRKKQRRLIPGLGNQLMALGGHLAPRLLEWGMKRAILQKIEEREVIGHEKLGGWEVGQ